MFNSVIIEGSVATAPISKDGRCAFRLKSERAEVAILVKEGHLSDICLEYSIFGRIVRIVGSLRNDPQGACYIDAEIVELRPGGETPAAK